MDTKASRAGSVIAFSTLNQPRWTPRRYDRFAEEGYKKNVIVHRAVGEIARSVAGVPLTLHHRTRTRESYGNHPLLRLLERPNPGQGGSKWMESVVAYLLISGNSYIEVVGDHKGAPKELYALRPDRMQVVPGKTGLPAGYVYSVGGQKVTYEADPLTGASSILHLKMFNPLDDWYGLSPIEAAAFSIDQHNAAGAHNQALLQNGARPVGALVYRPNAQAHQMTDEQRAQLKDQVQENYAGTHNAGKLLVLEGDFEWKEMGLRPRDMDFIEAKNVSARDIAQAFGVPSVLLGIPGDATYNNMAEARLALWEQTVIPLLERLMDDLNNWLTPQYDEGLRLGYNLDHVSALAPRRARTWERLQQADFLTVNEKRAAVGYPPLEDGDQIR